MALHHAGQSHHLQSNPSYIQPYLPIRPLSPDPPLRELATSHHDHPSRKRRVEKPGARSCASQTKLSPASRIHSANGGASKRKAEDLQPAVYACRVCTRSFDTDQALNGHARAVHGGHGSAHTSSHPENYVSPFYRGIKGDELKRTKFSSLQNTNYWQELLDQDSVRQENDYWNQRLRLSNEASPEAEAGTGEKRAEEKLEGEEISKAEEDHTSQGDDGKDIEQSHDARGGIAKHGSAEEDEAVSDTGIPTQKEEKMIKIRSVDRALATYSALGLGGDVENMFASPSRAKLIMQDRTLTKRTALYALRPHPKQSWTISDKDFETRENSAMRSAQNVGLTREEGGSAPKLVPTHDHHGLKALYGHMRSHPERDWRGALPPKHPSAPQSNNRKGGNHRYHDLAATHDHRLADMRDSTDNSTDLSLGMDIAIPTQDKKKIKKPNFICGASRMEKILPHSWICSDARLPREEVLNFLRAEEQLVYQRIKERYGDDISPDVIEAASILYLIASRPSPRPPSRSAKGLLDSKDPVRYEKNEDTVRHLCKYCNRVLSSPQALGGHITSHTKPHLISKPNLAEHAAGSMERTLQQYDGEPKEHKCTQCNKSFRSGQALGGHKRFHAEGRNKVAATNDKLPAQFLHKGKKSTRIATKLLKDCIFDLNLPAMEDESSAAESVLKGMEQNHGSTSSSPETCAN